MEGKMTLRVIGVGIFVMLTLQGLGGLIKSVLRKPLFLTELSSELIAIISEFGTMLLVLFVFYLIARRLIANDFTTPRLVNRSLWTFIIAYFVTQILAFAEVFTINWYFESEHFLDKSAEYGRSGMSDGSFINIYISPIVGLLNILCIALIIFFGAKRHIAMHKDNG